MPQRPLAFVECGLIGVGFSLVFPALGVEAANAFPPAGRGSVLGIYSSFVDFSLFGVRDIWTAPMPTAMKSRHVPSLMLVVSAFTFETTDRA